MTSKYRVVLIDDEYLVREGLKNRLKTRHADFDVVGEAENVSEALALFEQLAVIDGVFMDINLQTESNRAGLDLAFNLQQRDNPPWLIFVTAYKDFALEAIGLHPAAYLLKPFDVSALDSALAYIRRLPVRSADTQRFSVRHRVALAPDQKEWRTSFITAEAISCIRKNQGGSGVDIKTADGVWLNHVAGTLEEWLEKLNRPYFQRCHRSYVVNIKHIDHYRPHPYMKEVYQLKLKNCDEYLPIGGTFYSSLKDLT